MNNLKIKLGIFSLLTILAVSVFFIACEQEQLIPKQVEIEQDFRVSAKYQKKITVTDGLNSVVLGISSDNKEAFDLYTEKAYTLNSLTKKELSKLETDMAVETEDTSEKKSDKIDFEIPDDKDAVHIEILSKKMSKNSAGLNIQVNIPTDNTKASGTRDKCTYHYSWAAPHEFLFWRLDDGKFCRKAERIDNGAPDWKNKKTLRYWQCNDTWEYIFSSTNDWDTRAYVCPHNGDSYGYVVR